ncbi:AKH_1a_G0051910.mRNA.1.CDS.1 [Saccharomyces cerevisiae]|nr:AKH_1a_G0051910.mRNA.1.CDS.1 [Saccharomyces cerevisiae]CAI6892941.1 AKH_1a_G0051910.mRNA.1.CDS.1 [Saccharomyces cerevisiae]
MSSFAAMQYFRYPILPKSFFTGGWMFLRREDYQSWMLVNVPIASSATPRQEKKYSHARIYRIA